MLASCGYVQMDQRHLKISDSRTRAERGDASAPSRCNHRALSRACCLPAAVRGISESGICLAVHRLLANASVQQASRAEFSRTQVPLTGGYPVRRAVRTI